MGLRTVLLVAAGTAAVLATSGCSTVNTAPDQIALHYSGGPLSSQKFKECVPAGERDFNGPGEKYFYYPAGQRSYKFSSDDGSEGGPLTAVTKDQQELAVKGTVTFSLNTDCEMLRKFHDIIGRKFQAYSTEGGKEPGDGWERMLGTYIKDPVDRAIDNEALKYGWEQLYSDAAAKAQWERDVVTTIPDLINRQAGDAFFTIHNVVLQNPDISSGLKDQLAAKQVAILRQQAAAIDVQTAETFPGGIQAYLAYQQQLAVSEAIKEGRVQVLPVPAGSSVIVQPK